MISLIVIDCLGSCQSSRDDAETVVGWNNYLNFHDDGLMSVYSSSRHRNFLGDAAVGVRRDVAEDRVNGAAYDGCKGQLSSYRRCPGRCDCWNQRWVIGGCFHCCYEARLVQQRDSYAGELMLIATDASCGVTGLEV